MIKILADQNFSGPVVRGLLRRLPDLDLIRTSDVGIGHFSDPQILAWAAKANRIVITHDVKTFGDYAYARIARSQPVCGVILAPSKMPIGHAIEQIQIAIECTKDDEWANSVLRLPL